MPLPLILPFVGRATLTEALGAAVMRLRRGGRETTLLSGEAGVGKSRLLTLAEREAAERGFTVASGRAFEVERGIPYAVIADAVAPLLHALDRASLSTLTRGATAGLATILPTIFEPSAGEQSEDARARAWWSFSQLLGRLSARTPLLLAFDNLQWADAASLELLHFLARQPAAKGDAVLILAAFAPATGTDDTMLRTTVASLGALGVVPLRVEPLTPDEVRELVTRTFTAAGATMERFAARLHEWTAGNPFFIEETLRELVASGQLVEESGRWRGWQFDELTAPRSVRDAIALRARRLGTPARTLLDLVATVGSRVRHDLLCAARGTNEDDVLDAVGQLRSAGLLVERDDAGRVSYEFIHPLVREAIYAAIPARQAQRLHARVVDAMERLYADDPLAHADEFAHHAIRRGDDARSAQTVKYLAEAGRRSLDRHADRSAADYFTAAVRIADELPDSRPEQGRSLRDGLARALQRIGRHDEARAIWSRLVTEAADRGDFSVVAAIERRMALMSAARGRHDDAIRHFDTGIAAAESARDNPQLERLLLARATSLHAAARRDDALCDARRALAIAANSGSPASLAREHRALLLLHTFTGPPADARAHGDQALHFADVAGDLSLQWSVHCAMAIHSALTGNAHATAAHLEDCARLALSVGSPSLELRTADVEIEFLSARGEWRAALSRAEQAIPLTRALGQRTLLARLLVWTALVHRGLGDLPRASSMIDEAASITGVGDTPDAELDVHAAVPVLMGRTGVLMTRGDNAGALATGEAALRIADRSGYGAWSVYRLLPFVIETSLYLEDYDRADRHNQRLRRESEALGHALGVAWADTADALLTFLRGGVAESLPRLRAAVDALAAVPFAFDAARLRRLVARALAQAGDLAGAHAELRRAHQAFTSLGAERELRATREQMRALGMRAPLRTGDARARSDAGVLTARELEIATLVAARKTNKEIAGALDISPRTVSTHLSNIFEKVGVESRGELTDIIREQRLQGQ